MKPRRTQEHKISVVDGVTIRSALEARWATFFSAFGLKWEYEPTSFRLRDGHTYTPDFKIEGLGWLEVKPTVGLLKESVRKMQQWFSEHPDLELYAFCSDRPRFRHGEVVMFSKRKIYLPNEEQICAKLTRARDNTSTAILHDAIQAALVSANVARIDHMVAVADQFTLNRDRIAPFPRFKDIRSALQETHQPKEKMGLIYLTDRP